MKTKSNDTAQSNENYLVTSRHQKTWRCDALQLRAAWRRASRSAL